MARKPDPLGSLIDRFETLLGTNPSEAKAAMIIMERMVKATAPKPVTGIGAVPAKKRGPGRPPNQPKAGMASLEEQEVSQGA